MNLRGGWALIKNTWLSWLQHRSFFFLLAFGWMIPPLIYLFVWATAAGGETIGGFSRGEFVAYYHQRPHSSLDGNSPVPRRMENGPGDIISSPVLGGLHHTYRRAA